MKTRLLVLCFLLFFSVVMSSNSVIAETCSWEGSFTDDITVRSLTLSTDALEPGAIVQVNGLLQAETRTEIDFLAIAVELERDETDFVSEITYDDEFVLFEAVSFEQNHLLSRQTTYTLDGSGIYTFTPTLVVNQTTYTLDSCMFAVTPDNYAITLNASALFVALQDEVVLTANAAFGTVTADAVAILADNRVIVACENEQTCIGTYSTRRKDKVTFRAQARYGDELVYSSSLYVHFVHDVDPPTIDISFVPSFPTVGDLVTITVQADDASVTDSVSLIVGETSLGRCNAEYCTFSYRIISPKTTLLITAEDIFGNAQTYIRHLRAQGNALNENVSSEYAAPVADTVLSPAFVNSTAVSESATVSIDVDSAQNTTLSADSMSLVDDDEVNSIAESWQVTKHVTAATTVLNFTSKARLFAMVLLLLSVGVVVIAVLVSRSNR